MKRISVAALAAAVLLCCGCTDISGRTLPVKADESEAPVSTAEEAETSAETDAEEETEEFSTVLGGYTFTGSDMEFVSDCLFAGDSICRGLKVYGLVPEDRCFGEVGGAARNLSDFTFSYNGEELPLTEIIGLVKPRHIVLSMGMNDINMTDAEQFAENYNRLISSIEEVCPDADIFIMAITPVTAESSFAYNSRIDSYNAVLRNNVANESGRCFVDIGTELKDPTGALAAEFASSDDGVHLTKTAYYGILWRICRTAAKQNGEITG